MRLILTDDQLQSERLSGVMQRLAQLCQREGMTLGSLLHELSVYGHMLVCMLFAMPFLLPIPLPGLSTIFGFVIGIAAIQVIIGQDPWVPVSWRERKISADVLGKMFDSAQRFLQKTERLIKPRLKFFAHHPGFVRFNALVILITAILLSLPMPPGFNAPPALAIIILAVGSIEKDGFVVIFGYMMAAINALLFGLFFSLGVDGVRSLLGF